EELELVLQPVDNALEGRPSGILEPINSSLDSLFDGIPNRKDDTVVEPLSCSSNGIPSGLEDRPTRVDEPINRGLNSLLDCIPNRQDNRLVQPLSNRSNDVLPIPHQQLNVGNHCGHYNRDGDLNAFPDRLDDVVIQPEGYRCKNILPVEDQHLDIGHNSLDHDINGDLDTVPDLQNDVVIQPEGSTHDSVPCRSQQGNNCVHEPIGNSSGSILDCRPNFFPDLLTSFSLGEEPGKASNQGCNANNDEPNRPSGEPNSSPEHTRRNGSGLLRSRGSLLRDSTSLSGNRSAGSSYRLLGVSQSLSLRRISREQTRLSGLHRGNVTLNLQRQRSDIQRHVRLESQVRCSHRTLVSHEAGNNVRHQLDQCISMLSNEGQSISHQLESQRQQSRRGSSNQQEGLSNALQNRANTATHTREIRHLDPSKGVDKARERREVRILEGVNHLMDPMSCLLHEPREARRGNYSVIPFPGISEGVDPSLHPIPGSAGDVGKLLHE